MESKSRDRGQCNSTNTVLKLKYPSLEFRLKPKVYVGLLEVREARLGSVLAAVSLKLIFFLLGLIP